MLEDVKEFMITAQPYMESIREYYQSSMKNQSKHRVYESHKKKMIAKRRKRNKNR